MSFKSEKCTIALLFLAKYVPVYCFPAKTLGYVANPAFQKRECKKFRQIVGYIWHAADQGRKNKLPASLQNLIVVLAFVVP